MYQAFKGMSNKVAINTDLRLLLDDPKTPDPQFTVVVDVALRGDMTVYIGETFLEPSGLFTLHWWVTDMDQSGESSLGQITGRNNPMIMSHGTVRQKFTGTEFPAELEASVFQDLTIPGYGTLRLATPVKIGAEINSIPPFDIKAAHRTSGLLIDQNNIARGMVDGRSVTLVGPA